MNLHNVGLLIRLRYKLMWAKTRSRNGKIALFVVGYLFLVLILILLAAGGLGAAILAVRSGKAELVAEAVLGALYVQAIFATVMLGFGMSAVFTDGELRRYPLTLRERRITRHLIGIADPFWFLILALELGLGVGLWVLGDFHIVLVLAAILLLFLSNYLLARIISLAIERVASRKSRVGRPDGAGDVPGFPARTGHTQAGQKQGQPGGTGGRTAMEPALRRRGRHDPARPGGTAPDWPW